MTRRIFIKFGMDGMPVQANPQFPVIGNTDVTDVQNS
jgi:hypothetical protein